MRIKVIKNILSDNSEVFNVFIMDDSNDEEIEIPCLSEKHAYTLKDIMIREIERATGMRMDEWGLY